MSGTRRLPHITTKGPSTQNMERTLTNQDRQSKRKMGKGFNRHLTKGYEKVLNNICHQGDTD